MQLVRNLFLPLCITILASLWLLPSLDNGMLWQDEAQTALLARTTLHHGAPIAFDGANSISQEEGDDYGPHQLWKWHMWLPFYVLAVFFKVFGESTAIARLPFALFGVATVVLAYFTSMRIWRDWKSATIASLLILVCIPFALLVRQCRYYSPCMFFSLLMLDAYLRICGGWRRGWILLAIAATLLFNSHFIYTATAFAAIGLHALLWHRHKWKPLSFAAITTAILCSPPSLWLASLNYRNYSKGVMTSHFLRFQIHTYARDVLVHILPYPLLLLPVALAVKFILNNLTPVLRNSAEPASSSLNPSRKASPDPAPNPSPAPSSDPVLQRPSEPAPQTTLHYDPAAIAPEPISLKRKFRFAFASLEPWMLPFFFAAFTVVAIAPFTPWPFFRYVGPLIAPLLILAGRWVIVAFRTHLLLGAGTVVLLALWWPDSLYLHELRHRYQGPIEGIVQLLKSQGNPGDVVVTSYEDLPLKFYTKDRVYGGMTGDDLSKARGARWLILRSHNVSDRVKPVEQFIKAQVAMNPSYRPITLDVTDSKFENREEPSEHLYRSPTGAPKVVVYRLEP
jgi:hypothetical protein